MHIQSKKGGYMHFFDTHIHLTDFKNISTSDLIKKLQSSGIQKCICVSAKSDEWKKISEFAHDYPFEVIPCFGIHPWYVEQEDEQAIKLLEDYIKHFPNALIGECGFDAIKNQNFDRQEQFFNFQIDLAHSYHRPLVLHMVKAQKYIEKYLALLPQKSVFHSYSGSKDLLNKIFKYQFYISVNKRFFLKKESFSILESTPLNHLLIETDAPFQSNISDLFEVVQKIAEIKHKNIEEVSEILYLNAMEFALDE